MSKWTLNPTARIELAFGPSLAIGPAECATHERLDDSGRIEGLYRLASLASDALNAFVERALANDDLAVRTLIETGLLVAQAEGTLRPLSSDSAFVLDAFAGMHEFALAKEPRLRDGVTIFDEVLPEPMRYSIDVWSRRIAYNRLDIDHSDAADLHWIHVLSPCAQHVQALPFLRALDSLIRLHMGEQLRIMRSYLYAGQFNDIYHTHADSAQSDDVTAIYYPPRWEDHWGGDLIFYDGGEPRWAIAPRGNSLIVFQGARRHRISPVSIAAKASRCSLVLRYGRA